jgi:hypothetical protein
VTAAEPELDDVAARALASIILEQTAEAVDNGGAGSAGALVALSDLTGMSLDVCAGVLMATSWLAGTGGIMPVAINAGAMGLDPAGEAE